jgi:hypothetical protein
MVELVKNLQAPVGLLLGLRCVATLGSQACHPKQRSAQAFRRVQRLRDCVGLPERHFSFRQFLQLQIQFAHMA